MAFFPGYMSVIYSILRAVGGYVQMMPYNISLQQIRYFYAVGPNDLRPQGMGWKIGIGKYDRIAMSHFAENFQKFRRKQG